MALIEAASPHTMNTYGRLPIALERGQGVRVWDGWIDLTRLRVEPRRP